ncbi:phosphoglycerol transferase MdoB-like AlkP superfamily enzyme [Dyella sp. SG562]|uniref:LTA synthase family protein n=1 Tax=Dyella sp. SG562 TaxID=2587017 RepID=UPI001421E931|nr:LTA synthase family protein [Dyella sp. SG562]NII73589.1 phosphoglycerol transferase MdoB-like AlkP superfamily enzyme [Dyella sp. SG562]
MTKTLNPAARPGLARRVALPLMLAVAFVLFTGWLDGGEGVAPQQLFQQPLYLLANALPGLLLALLLMVLSRRPLLSFGLAFLLQGVLYGVNALKVRQLGTPLMPADFRMLGQLRKGGLHLLGGYLPTTPWPYLALAAGIALVVLAWRKELPLFPRRTRGKRLLAGASVLVVLGSLLGGAPAWGRFYDGETLWMEPWSASSTAQHSGLVSSLMMFHLHFGQQRKKADPNAAMQLIGQADGALRERMRGASGDTGAMPDIVVVQSESFFDPAILKGFEHHDLTPNLHRLAQQGYSGALHVPTFGGGTIRTEFEVLTGLSLRYFDDLQFPYLQLNTKVVPGMVRTLRSHGYRTMAIHGNNPAFWNRSTAFRAIGFDRFVSQGGFVNAKDLDGQYMADRAMTDEIMAQLKDAGPPQFLFAISIEAHGPYDVTPADAVKRDAIPVPDGLAAEDKTELRNYLYHMQHADEELGRLASLLAQRERPTLLLFYGDHLPGLSGSFETLGFVDGKDMLSEPGTWLLVDPRNQVQPQREDLASWMLPGKVLEQAGIHDDAYFALTQVLAPQLAALTRAPGAPPQAEDGSEQRIDAAMESVALLRLKGRLDRMLPRADALSEHTGFAQEGAAPAAATEGAHQ